jgi:S1-C subfamily serine protease
MVAEVRPDGLAARAGIEKGDELAQAAKAPVTTIGSFESQLLAVKGGNTLELELRRSGRSYETKLSLDADHVSPSGQGAPGTPTPSAAETNIFGMFVHQDASGAVVVDEVSPMSPAAKAGLRAGDVLLSFGGHPASPIEQLMPFATGMISRKQPGQSVPIEVRRNNVTAIVQMLGTDTSGASQGNSSSGSSAVKQEAVAAEAMLLGLALRDVSPNTVCVTNVAVGSPAKAAGIAPGDVIGTIDQQQVSTVAQFVSLIGVRQMGDQLNLVVLRQNKPFPTTMSLTPRLQDVSQACVAVATSIMQQEIQTLETRMQAQAEQIQTLQMQSASTNARK